MLPRWNVYDHGPPFLVPIHREYELTVRQEPKQARMCGVGGKADRRPIDPPPIVQLRVIDPTQRNRNNPKRDAQRRATSPETGSVTPTPGGRPASPGTSTANAGHSGSDSVAQEGSNSDVVSTYADSFLQNPYYFMFASLAKPDDDAELHWLKDGKTRCTTGSVVSSLYHLKDPQNQNEDAGFFVFPDLSVRTEGSYRLKLSLFEVVDNSVRHCKSIFSAPFYVYTAKKFPGMEESTPLSCSLADQGIKIRIRKDIRVRKRPMQALEHPLGPSPSFAGTPLGPVPGAGPLQPLGPVPGVAGPTPYVPPPLNANGSIPPPPGASLNIPLPPGATINIPPPPGATVTIPPPSGSVNNSDTPIPLPIPQANPHGGLSLPDVDRRSLPMPSAPGIGKGVVIDEDERPPVVQDARRGTTDSIDTMEEEDDYDDHVAEEDDDDDEYRENGKVQVNIGRRNPSTRPRKSTSKRKELERRTGKVKAKIQMEDEDEYIDDDVMAIDQDNSSGRRGKKFSKKGREIKRQKRADDDHSAERGNETSPDEIAGEQPSQSLSQPHSQQPPAHHPYASYHPPQPHAPWGHHPVGIDQQPPPNTASQNGAPMNIESTGNNGMVYDARYQQSYYEASQPQPQQQQPYQGPPHPPPPSTGQYISPGYPPPPGQYGYSIPHHPPPPGQYSHQQYFQPGVQGWAPPPPTMNYPPPHQQVPGYGPPPSANDPYANYPHPPHASQQPQHQQQYQPRYDYGGPPPHPHSMYGPPPPPPHYPGYYEPSHAPPAPQQQYGNVSTASPTPVASGSNPPPASSEGPPRGDYSNGTNVPAQGQRSVSPGAGPRYPTMPPPPIPPPTHHIPQPHYYQPPIPPPIQHYPSPYNMYGMYPGNVPPSNAGDPWGTPPTSAPNWQGNTNSEAYPSGTQSQQGFNQQQVLMQTRSQQIQPTQIVSGDRIQLAPLRVGASITSSSPTSSSAASGNISPTVSSASASHRSAGADTFPVIQLRSSSRSGTGYNGPPPTRDRDERDRDADRGRRDERGKKNPLSIGSIISD